MKRFSCGLRSFAFNQLVVVLLVLGTFTSDYDYEYDYDFWAREAWVLAVVDTVVAVVSRNKNISVIFASTKLY